MSLTTQWIRFGDDPVVGYLCYPTRAKMPLPAVVVLQEAWGVDEHIQDVTRRFALAGYAAFAPDLFAKNGERPSTLTPERIAEVRGFVDALPPAAWGDPVARDAALANRPEAECARITESFAAVMDCAKNAAALIPTVLASTRWLRTECAESRGQPIGSVGFCMGGSVSALLAVNDPELRAAVICYGSAPPLDAIPKIACPILGLYGGLDERINTQVPAFEEAMKRHGKRFERVTYDGARHAFFNDTRPAYDVRASRDAFVRMLETFRTELGG